MIQSQWTILFHLKYKANAIWLQGSSSAWQVKQGHRMPRELSFQSGCRHWLSHSREQCALTPPSPSWKLGEERALGRQRRQNCLEQCLPHTQPGTAQACGLRSEMPVPRWLSNRKHVKLEKGNMVPRPSITWHSSGLWGQHLIIVAPKYEYLNSGQILPPNKIWHQIYKNKVGLQNFLYLKLRWGMWTWNCWGRDL